MRINKDTFTSHRPPSRREHRLEVREVVHAEGSAYETLEVIVDHHRERVVRLALGTSRGARARPACSATVPSNGGTVDDLASSGAASNPTQRHGSSRSLGEGGRKPGSQRVAFNPQAPEVVPCVGHSLAELVGVAVCCALAPRRPRVVSARHGRLLGLVPAAGRTTAHARRARPGGGLVRTRGWRRAEPPSCSAEGPPPARCDQPGPVAQPAGEGAPRGPRRGRGRCIGHLWPRRAAEAAGDAHATGLDLAASTAARATASSCRRRAAQASASRGRTVSHAQQTFFA